MVALALAVLLIFAPLTTVGLGSGFFLLKLIEAGTHTALSTAQEVLVLVSCVTVLIAAATAATYIAPFLKLRERGPQVSAFPLFALCLTAMLALNGANFVDYVIEIVTRVSADSGYNYALLATHAFSAAFFCGALIAFVVIAINALIEIPAEWISSAANVRTLIRPKDLRILVTVLALSIGFNLIVGFVANNLSSRNLLIP